MHTKHRIYWTGHTTEDSLQWTKRDEEMGKGAQRRLSCQDHERLRHEVGSLMPNTRQ